MINQTFLKPIVVVSQCLEFASCRYDGQMIRADFIRQLQPFVTFKKVCPEVSIGLGTPRPAIKLVLQNDEVTLHQPTTGRDVTKPMNQFTKDYLDSLRGVDGFILKSKSPSCGTKDVKIFPQVEKSMTIAKGPGLFAAQVLDRFGHLAIEDEGRLLNLRIREHFLTKLFMLAKFRHLKKSPSKKKLVKFHADHKYLLMAYSETQLRCMGRIVGDLNSDTIANLIQSYEHHLHLAFSRIPRYTSHINVLMHVFGHFKKDITPKEKQQFLHLLDQYRDHKISLSVVVHMLRMWVIRFDEAYLQDQRYLNPFPEELTNLTDSGHPASFKRESICLHASGSASP